MSSLSHKNSLPISKLLLGFWLLTLQGWSGAVAQSQNHRNLRELVIGELVGKTDMRRLTVLTSEGEIPAFGQGNGKPFTVFSTSRNRVVLQFHASPLIESNNPNRLVFQFYETERALISALILDEVDVGVLDDEVSASEVRNANHHILALPVAMKPNTVKMVCYNHRNPILKSSKVRVALSYAIDHNAIIKKIILKGKATIARGPYDTDSRLYNPGMETYKYNPKQAIRLLKEAGWRDRDHDGILDRNGVPFRLQLFYPKGLRLEEAISRQILINLIKVGVEVTPRPLSKHELNLRLESGEFDAVLMDYTFEENLDALEAFFSAQGDKNYMGYNSKSLQTYLKLAHDVTNEKQRNGLIKSMQNVINRDQPVTFLYFKWWTHYMINVQKFDNYRDLSGKIKPFDQWRILQLLK